MKSKIFGIMLTLLLVINLGTAMVISGIEAEKIKPGGEGKVSIKVRNILDYTARDISVSIDLTKLPFVPVSGSEKSLDELGDGDSDGFTFYVKAANDAKAGDYEVPYRMSYKANGTAYIKEGTLGITIDANPELSYSVGVDKPVVGETGKISLKIVNTGLGNAKFVSVKILPEGSYILLSADEAYIGNVDSDDFETVNFDVIFKQQNAYLNAEIKYKDQNNNEIVKTTSLPFNVYSREKAIELGIVNKSNLSIYVFIGIVFIGAWIVWGRMKKKKRMERAQSSR